MKLYFNDVPLHDLGVLRLLSEHTAREGEQAERVTLRVRLDFFEPGYAANRSLVDQLRAALRTQRVPLRWESDDGTEHLNRFVLAGDDEWPEDPNGSGGNSPPGTYRQAVLFSFSYVRHDVASNALAGTVTPVGGATLSLGHVEKWAERLVLTRRDAGRPDLEPALERIAVVVQTSGRLPGDTTLSAAECRTALLAAQTALQTALQTQATAQLVYGGFDQAVTVKDFEADVDQAHFAITWKLTAEVVLWPAAGDFDALTVGDSLDMGVVEKWTERVAVQRTESHRPERQRVLLTAQAQGRWVGDLALAPAARKDALLKTKADATEQLSAASVRLRYQSADVTGMVRDFEADPANAYESVPWKLTAEVVLWPSPTNFALVDLTVARRTASADGIAHLTLSGTIEADSRERAITRLDALRASLVPEGYVLLQDELTDQDSLAASGDTVEGLNFFALRFSCEYRDTAGVACTFTVTGGTALDLGTVETFTERNGVQVADALHPLPRRATGTVSARGHWWSTASTVGEQQAELAAHLTALRTALARGCNGVLAYGTLFNQELTLQDFDADIHRQRQRIEWNLTATYVQFPNPSDFALTDLTIRDAEDMNDGKVTRVLSGRIAAPTVEAARAKLVKVRAASAAGYSLLRSETSEQRFDSENTPTGGSLATAATFIELSFDESWQKTAGNIMEANLRVTDEDDVRSGWLRTTYAGTVLAHAAYAGTVLATQAAAQALARDRATELGAGKYPFLVRSTITYDEKLVQTLAANGVNALVQFSYEYQRRGTKTYLEYTAERQKDTFGRTVENVSGVIAAPTLELASTAYATIRALYPNALLLSERLPTASTQQLVGVANTTQHDRYTFGFTVHCDKTDVVLRYDLEPVSNYLTLEKTTTVRGAVFAATLLAADSALNTLLGTLSLGQRVNSSRVERREQGVKLSGAAVTAFVALDFQETYLDRLTGPDSGILECECSEEITYSGDRLVELPIPDGPSVLQKCGTTVALRTVQASVTATTRAAAEAWLRKIRTALLVGQEGEDEKFEHPPRLAITHKFVPLTDGTPNGAAVNVRCYQGNATFSEWLPELGYSA